MWFILEIWRYYPNTRLNSEIRYTTTSTWYCCILEYWHVLSGAWNCVVLECGMSQNRMPHGGKAINKYIEHTLTTNTRHECFRTSQAPNIVTSSSGNMFRVTGPLWGEFTGHRWTSRTKASDTELWCFLWSAPEQTFEYTIETPVIWDSIVLIMMSL